MTMIDCVYFDLDWITLEDGDIWEQYGCDLTKGACELACDIIDSCPNKK